jgi:Tfp pilus assembly ATPase PilU
LPNALREAPDLIMIGEVRDRETMQHALLHTLTGHLCLSTLHANNSYHALSRIINMFPHDARSGRAVRPVDRPPRHRLAAARAQQRRRAAARGRDLLNTSLIAELIKNGEITQIKEAMEQSLYPGSQTFEQALCSAYLDESSVRRGDDRGRFADEPRVADQSRIPHARVDGLAIRKGRNAERPHDAISRRSNRRRRCHGPTRP